MPNFMKRRGFTILELLVVIGIIALLLGLLLPALLRVRGVAIKVVCSARLRDLTLAATLYQGDNKLYPQPLQTVQVVAGSPATFRPSPERISGELLNQLRRYLNFPEVTPTTPASALPPFVQCPFIEMQGEQRGPFAPPVATLTPTYYTGYSYCGRLNEIAVPATPASPSTPSPTTILPGIPTLNLPLPIQLPNLPLIGGLVPTLEPGIELRPGRAASAKAGKRAVLWSDTIRQAKSADKPWQYTHTRRAIRGSGTLDYSNAGELLGQHRSFSDGSIEWVPAGSDELKLKESTNDNLRTASFTTLPGELWWF